MNSIYSYKDYWINYSYNDKKIFILDPKGVEIHKFDSESREIGEAKSVIYIDNLTKK